MSEPTLISELESLVRSIGDDISDCRQVGERPRHQPMSLQHGDDLAQLVLDLARQVQTLKEENGLSDGS